MPSASPDITDEHLAIQVGQGDNHAFAQLVQRHTTRFFKVAYGVVLNPQDAEDVVQDAFLKLWNGKATWQEGRNNTFTTWFYRIVYNQALDHLRKRPPFHVVQDDEKHASAEKPVDEQVAEQETSLAVDAAIGKLPERQRTALMLAYKEELPQAECADIMGISVKALESLLSRGKATLKERMKEYDGRNRTEAKSMEQARA